jgi:hypothetical protein
MAATDKATISVLTSGPGAIPLNSKTDFNAVALTAGNFASQNTKLQSLEVAYANMTAGTVKDTSFAHITPVGAAYPATIANRGQKWIISATNTAGRKFTYTIPAAPGNGELLSDNISADLSGTNWAAFVTAFNAFATDPDGNSLTLNTAKLGGRRA